MLFSDFSETFFVNLNFRIFSENYHKIVWTATAHSSHHVKATDFRTGKTLTEKLGKQNIN